MKKCILILFTIISFYANAQLTIDQKATISNSATFQSRVQQILLEKAQYWKNIETASRASVNVQMQKRKRFARTLLSTQDAASNYKLVACNFWLSITTTATLDGNGIPTATAIGDAFDSTFDYLAGYTSGDENKTEIDW
jgi:hypothetical protein